MINLYTIHCPKCNILEKKLQEHNIQYNTITDEKIIREKNLEILPYLEIDGELLDFSNSIKWVNQQ